MYYEHVPSEELTLVEPPKDGRDFGVHHFRNKRGATVAAYPHEFSKDCDGHYWSVPYLECKERKRRSCIV